MRLNLSRSSAHILSVHNHCTCDRCNQISAQIREKLQALNVHKAVQKIKRQGAK